MSVNDGEVRNPLWICVWATHKPGERALSNCCLMRLNCEAQRTGNAIDADARRSQLSQRALLDILCSLVPSCVLLLMQWQEGERVPQKRLCDACFTSLEFNRNHEEY